MTAHDILAAWRTATAAGGAQFYAEFERLTGFDEAAVKAHFAAWGKLRHETAEEIASNNGVTLREGGFQAYLAHIKRVGRPPIIAITDDGYEADEDPNPRQNKPWPESEDCTGCDGRAGAEYPHRFRCHARGVQQIRIPVTQGADGKFRAGS